ncbi:hypothetical protein PHABIO_268 [Pseudomonas phage Phabio]|uniref:Uncharacterized protein n=1 Tax=Pseudomonas phage Phabio TaxID=2006668 RepID=A0A1Y0SZF2_9CAUD|nr:hypothetical protein MZD05_gp268 [Pseudomonas phage Phabio]ARV76899.1 hypothetical protein PHABIO_268 [Pseudomonas phage Phabio]
MNTKVSDLIFEKLESSLLNWWDSLFPGEPEPTYSSAMEKSIYNMCKEFAYKDSRKFIFEGLHKAFKETIEANKRTPARIHRELRRVIYRDVAKIENTEVRDNVILQYSLIYNLNQTEGNTK